MQEKQFLQKIENKKVIIYGAGNYATIMAEFLERNGTLIECFCVTNIDENKCEILRKRVLSIDTVLAQCGNEEVIFIIAVKGKPGKDIEQILISKGCNNYIFYLEEIINESVSVSEYKNRPTLEITPKIGCSVNCKYCPQTKLLQEYFGNNKNRQSVMTLEVFKKCLQKMPADTLIEFSGFVEPFLNVEAIDMMEYANENGFELTLYTTLVGVDKNTLDRLLKIPFKTVVLHTADKDGYAKIPVTEEYVKLLSKIIEAKRDDGSPFLSSANCQSSPHDKVLDVSAGKLKISCEMSDRAGNLENQDGKLSGMKVDGQIYCSRANNLDHNVLLPDGTIVLCCNDFGMQHVLGNLLGQKYEDIIHSEAMRDVKRAMNIDFDKDVICRKCMFAKKRV